MLLHFIFLLKKGLNSKWKFFYPINRLITRMVSCRSRNSRNLFKAPGWMRASHLPFWIAESSFCIRSGFKAGSESKTSSAHRSSAMSWAPVFVWAIQTEERGRSECCWMGSDGWSSPSTHFVCDYGEVRGQIHRAASVVRATGGMWFPLSVVGVNDTRWGMTRKLQEKRSVKYE